MICSSVQSIQPEAIVDFLKREIILKDVYKRVLSQQIINQTVKEKGITLTPEEIQAEADRQRHQRHLESSTATFSWLAEQLMTPEDWEAGISDRLLSIKLAESLFGHEIEKYFVEHQLEFEQVLLYQLAVPYLQLAQELLYQIEENEIGFYEAAHLYDLDEQRRLQFGYAGKLYRWSFSPEISAILLGANTGEVIGPVQSEQSYLLLMVEEFIPARLTPEIRQTILDRLFQNWLSHELTLIS
ncbi:MAG: peptidylprolyl isomerase [Leptolyngbyaceae cyanobacterium CSU_1_4]|nr:peptidylprolyl isomerase [Leptolyngbyaceae cyanobacterium CSU_1_4]